MSSRIQSKFSFHRPACYEIKVEGLLNKNWEEKLQGLIISSERYPNGDQISVLKGQINDQAALSGILNTLYDMKMTIISVNTL